MRTLENIFPEVGKSLYSGASWNCSHISYFYTFMNVLLDGKNFVFWNQDMRHVGRASLRRRTVAGIGFEGK